MLSLAFIHTFLLLLSLFIFLINHQNVKIIKKAHHYFPQSNVIFLDYSYNYVFINQFHVPKCENLLLFLSRLTFFKW